MNYAGPFNQTGYGVASASLACALKVINKQLYYKVIGAPDTTLLHDSIIDFSKKPLEYSSLVQNTICDYRESVFCFWHLHDIPNQLMEFKGKKVGYTTFETLDLRPNEISALSTLDKIGTASTWGANILKKYVKNPDDVFIVPHALLADDNSSLKNQTIKRIHNDRFEITREIRESWIGVIAPNRIPDSTLVLGSAGKFESRKGHPELIEACENLSKEIPILLIAYWNNPFIQGNFPFGLLNSRFFEPLFTSSGLKLFKKNNFYILLMPKTGTRSSLHTALQNVHAFIAPSKGEGWNLPLFEMMSFGVPCIATNCSGHTEYCTNENIIPIPHGDVIKAKDDFFFDGTTSWYDVTPKAIESGISSFLNSTNIEEITKKAKESTKEFTWQKNAQKVHQMMSIL